METNPPPYDMIYGSYGPSAPPHSGSSVLLGETPKKISNSKLLCLMIIITLVTCISLVTLPMAIFSTVKDVDLNSRLDVLDAGGKWTNLAQHMNQLQDEMDNNVKTVGQLKENQKKIIERVGALEYQMSHMTGKFTARAHSQMLAVLIFISVVISIVFL